MHVDVFGVGLIRTGVGLAVLAASATAVMGADASAMTILADIDGTVDIGRGMIDEVGPLETSRSQVAVVTFDLTSTAAPSSVVLRFRIERASGQAAVAVLSEPVVASDVDWSSPPNVREIGTLPGGGKGDWVELDVTSAVAAGSINTFQLSGKRGRYLSAESDSPPRLVVTIDPTSTTVAPSPSIHIATPTDGSVVVAGSSVDVEAVVDGLGATTDHLVEFYIDGEFIGAEESSPYDFVWAATAEQRGRRNLTARLRIDGSVISTSQIMLDIVDPSPSTSTTTSTTTTSTTSAPTATTTSSTTIPDGGRSGPTGAPISARTETEPVPHSGDAADDVAVWVDPIDPDRSVIIGTDKEGGLAVYDLVGRQLHFYDVGRPNNVDLREGFLFGSRRGALVAASERDADEILFFEVEPLTRSLRPAGSLQSSIGVSGLCLYHDLVTDSFSAFVSDSSGSIEHWQLQPDGDGVSGAKVRTLRLGSTTEGCVADDALGRLYVAEEDVGIWRFPARAEDGATAVLFAQTGTDGTRPLRADVEGLALAIGPGSDGYLVASSQGDSSFAVFARESNQFVGRFQVMDGSVDRVTYTDGIEVVTAPLGPAFPEGLFVAQDNDNDDGNQNFKLVSWSDVLESLIGTDDIGSTTSSTTTPPSSATTLPPGSATTTTTPALERGTTYYVDAIAGSDDSPGTRSDAPFATLDRATRELGPGDLLLLRRGASWSEELEILASGTSDSPVVVGAYGIGDDPLITGSSSCVRLTGDHIRISHLVIAGCSWAGVEVVGSHNEIVSNLIKDNVAGVYIKDAAVGTAVLGNRIVDNNLMSVNDPGGAGDSGAFGVLVHGRSSEIAYNVISGSDAASADYGRDGAAIEIYGGRDTHVHHNRAIDNHAFSELGESTAAGNRFDHNVVSSRLASSSFLVTRGAESSRGPVLGTVVEHNSVLLTGPDSQGFVCHAGCSVDVLTLRNNVIEASWKAGYADGPFLGGGNVFAGSITQFMLSEGDVVADPLWRNRSLFDLHLTSSSPAVAHGAPLGYPTDFDGRPRSLDHPDAGAYESL